MNWNKSLVRKQQRMIKTVLKKTARTEIDCQIREPSLDQISLCLHVWLRQALEHVLMHKEEIAASQKYYEELAMRLVEGDPLEPLQQLHYETRKNFQRADLAGMLVASAVAVAVKDLIRTRTIRRANHRARPILKKTARGSHASLTDGAVRRSSRLRRTRPAVERTK